jgi:hypothetical protein
LTVTTYIVYLIKPIVLRRLPQLAVAYFLLYALNFKRQ